MSNVTTGVSAWIAEGRYYNTVTGACNTPYDPNDPSLPQTCSDYEQIIWKNTTTVGCGYATASCGNAKFAALVCHYNPRKS